MIATKLDLAVLADLLERGGHGVLDVRGRVCTGPTREPVISDTTTWLRLVADGYIAGEHGKIIATEQGRAYASRLVGGYEAGTKEKAETK